MFDLYLDGSCSDGTIAVPCASAVTVYMLTYCQSSDFKIIFVSGKNSASEGTSCINLPVTSLDEFFIEFNSLDSVPDAIQQCILPACITSGGKKVLSGLCCVLRHIVKTSHQSDDLNFIHLLGHKEICLKACAEVSVWTKFCEVEIPKLVDSLLCDNACDTFKTTDMASKKKPQIMMPIELLKLENHFDQPPIIANRNKRKQDVLKKQKKTQSKCLNPTFTSNTSLEHSMEGVHLSDKSRENLEELEHNFVEGIDFTLADLRHWKTYLSSLEKHLPLTMNWCRRLSARPDVQKALKKSNLPLADLFNINLQQQDDKLLIQLPSDVENYNIREVKKKKFRANASQLTTAMDKFQKSGLVKEYEQHPCEDILLPWKKLPEAIHPKDGDLPEDRLERKCQQLENLAQAVVAVAKPGYTIVDFCSGGGHLGILLAYLLPDCHIILVENKEESIQKAEKRIDKLQLSNIVLYQCNLDYFQGRFDIGTCLHACGVATDLVLQCCLDNRASFVICPCCYGGIQDTHTVTYPRSSALQNTDMCYKEYLCIGHGADQTQPNSTSAKQGKQCMLYIDSDRAALAATKGYRVVLTTLQPPECSPKNNLLIGTKSS